MSTTISATGTYARNAAAATQTFGGFTVNSGDLLAIFFIVQENASSNTVTSVHWDSTGTNQLCTLIETQNCSAPADGSIGMYGVVNPTSGNKTLSVVQQLSQAMGAEMQSYIGCVSSSVAAACTLGVVTQNSNTNSSLPTITGANGDLDVGAFVTIGTITSINNTQTFKNVTNRESCAASAASTGAAITFTMVQGAGSINAGVGCNIVAAVAASPFVPYDMSDGSFTLARSLPPQQAYNPLLYPAVASTGKVSAPVITPALRRQIPQFDATRGLNPNLVPLVAAPFAQYDWVSGNFVPSVIQGVIQGSFAPLMATSPTITQMMGQILM